MSQQNTKTAGATLGPKANLVTFLLVLLGTLNFPMPAFSQTQVSVAQVTPDFFRQMKDFASIQDNLIEMAKTAAHKDSFALTQAFYFTSHLNSTATEVWKLAMIYQRLRDQRDVKEVALVFTSIATHKLRYIMSSHFFICYLPSERPDNTFFIRVSAVLPRIDFGNDGFTIWPTSI